MTGWDNSITKLNFQNTVLFLYDLKEKMGLLN